MRDHHEQIEELDARLCVIGNGSVAEARSFAERHAKGIRVLTDPDLVTYRALGARRGMMRSLNPKVFAQAFQAFRKGFRQEGVQGDPTQLGGVLVVETDGSLVFSALSEFAGDHPEPEVILSALRQR